MKAFVFLLMAIFIFANSAFAAHKKPSPQHKVIYKQKLKALPAHHKHYAYLGNFKSPLQNNVAAKKARALPAVIYGTSQLTAELNQSINALSDAKTQIGVYVKSMRYGDALFAHNIHRPMAPASTLKLLTAEAALLFLGGDYRFSTQLLTDAKKIKNGTLQGNLYIILSGDPTLTYYDLADLLIGLRTQQISSIAGDVYIDNTAYDQRFYGPGWQGKDKQYCYGAPISASIINHNCLAFKVSPTKGGQLAQITTSTKYFYPVIKNSVVTKNNSARSCYLHLSTLPNSEISIDGCLGNKQSWGLNYVVTNVSEYNRALFNDLFYRLHIKIYGKMFFKHAPENLSLISTHSSKPLRDLIQMMMKKSDNIIAGALFKKIGQLYTREPGSWENGSIAVSQILQKRTGMNIAGLRVLDGSGLSPNNLTTSAQMMQVLDYAYHQQNNFDFISALPIAGIDGTLKHRMSNIARKVRAKTGTISGVVALAGYVMSSDKEPIAFVILINGSKQDHWRFKALEDNIATALTHYTRSW